MTLRLVVPIALALSVAGCCVPCRKYWQAVGEGHFVDEERQAVLQQSLDDMYPTRFKSTGRVTIRRSGREQVFTLFLKADREERTLEIAGLNDIGNVMFAVAYADNAGVTIKKNRSGWSDDKLTDHLVRHCMRISLPRFHPGNIINDGDEGTVELRAKLDDGSIEEFIFDSMTVRLREQRLQTFHYWGEVTRRETIRYDDWKTMGNTKMPIPNRVIITTTAYTVNIALHKMTVLP